MQYCGFSTLLLARFTWDTHGLLRPRSPHPCAARWTSRDIAIDPPAAAGSGCFVREKAERNPGNRMIWPASQIPLDEQSDTNVNNN